MAGKAGGSLGPMNSQRGLYYEPQSSPRDIIAGHNGGPLKSLNDSTYDTERRMEQENHTRESQIRQQQEHQL